MVVGTKARLLEPSPIKVLSFRNKWSFPLYWRIFMMIDSLIQFNNFSFVLFNHLRFIRTSPYSEHPHKNLLPIHFSIADVLGCQSFFIKGFSTMENLLILINCTPNCNPVFGSSSTYPSFSHSIVQKYSVPLKWHRSADVAKPVSRWKV